MTNARIDQAIRETVTTGTPKSRIDQVVGESITAGTPKSRIDQSVLESVTVGTPKSRIDQILAEFVVSRGTGGVIPAIAFPSVNLLGSVGWSLHRRPTSSTRVAAAVNGREVRTPYYAVPLYEFEMTYDVLLSGANGAGGMADAQALQNLMGFFLQMQGQYGAFLFTDPDFNTVSAGYIGTGDGVTTQFPLLRSVGAYSEQIGAVNAATNVYYNGFLQASSTWTVAAGANVVNFVGPPPPGAIITMDFTYYFVCRFLDDVHDYEEFMYQMHTLKSCKLRSVRTS